MTHALKTHPEYFKAIVDGFKTFDIRINDRPFKPGDSILLQEYKPDDKTYTGREWSGNISYILYDDFPGLKKGYCILAIKEKE